MIQSLLANTYLLRNLEILLIAQLGLLDNPLPTKMYYALIFLGIEPLNAKDFLRLFDASSSADDDPMKGMPQI